MKVFGSTLDQNIWEVVYQISGSVVVASLYESKEHTTHLSSLFIKIPVEADTLSGAELACQSNAWQTEYRRVKVNHLYCYLP